MTGYEDLDEYGDWSYVAGYGMCWRPRVVVAGWAPYRFGHWVWVGPWGWTWVEDEPWGFAPFHYGRWAFAGRRMVVGSGTKRGAADVRARAGGVGWEVERESASRFRLEREWDGSRWLREKCLFPAIA